MSVLWGNIAFPKLTALWSQGDGCDVNLVCRNGVVKAPSILLSAVSEKLKEILNLSTDKVLTFKDTDVETWKCILQMLYSGSTGIVFQNEGSGNSLMALCSALSFAYCLNIQDVLNLYQHAAHMDNNRRMGELWEDFSMESGLEVALEFSRAENGKLTCYQTVFSNDNFIKLKDKIRKCHDVINLDCKDVELSEDRASLIEKVCVNCGLGSCQAKQVQCLYCSQTIDSESGPDHMEENHLLSPSAIWPVTCQINPKQEQCVKGKRFLKDSFCDKAGQFVQTVVYKCLVCNHSVQNIPSYISHFLSHGFFPEVCEYCGDAFSSEEISEKHAMFCGVKDKSAIIVSGDTAGSKKTSEPVKIQKTISADVENVSYETEDHKDNKQLKQATHILLEIDQEDMTTTSQSDTFTRLPKLANVKTHIKGKCNECGTSCESTTVQCLLCYRTVDNSVSHMFEDHPNCTQAKIWPFTCEVKRDSKEMVVRGLQNCSFECLLCHETFLEKEIIVDHLQDHRLHSVFFCKHCKTGFKSAINRNSHQHFCGGGDGTQCKQCKLFFSTFDQLQQHQLKKHKHVVHVKIEGTQSIKHKAGSQNEDVFVKPKTEPEEVFPDFSESAFMDPRKHMCISCGIPCGAEKVKCAYCYLVVNNMESHMEEKHPFTPKTSTWVYNCRFMTKTLETPTQWLVCTKVNRKSDGQGWNYHAYQCLRCKKESRSLKALLKHMKQKHYMVPIICEICESGFRGSRYLKDHEHFCKGGSLVECDLCSAVPGNFRLLGDHYRKHHPEATQQLTKNEKGNSPAGSSPNCKKRKLTHTFNTEDSSEDDGHQEEFEDGISLHLQTKTTKDSAGTASEIYTVDRVKFCTNCTGDCKAPRVKCLYCFQIVDNTLQHMARFHAFTPERCTWVFNCRFINSKAQSGESWVIFKKEFDGKSEDKQTTIVYKCIRCKKNNFTSLDMIRKHAIQNHRIKPKVCRVCEMGFVDGRYYKDHELFCRGGQPLGCQICDKKVGNYKNMSDHIRRIHPGTVNPLKCEPVFMQNEMEEMDFSVPDSELEAITAANHSDMLQRKNERTKTLENNKKNGKCIHCSDHCAAGKVKCLHCFHVVDRNSEHMTDVHAFTPKSSSWVYSCRFKYTQAESSERWMIFRRDYAQKENGDTRSKIIYKCLRCYKNFASLTSVEEHVQKMHNLKPKACPLCQMGFLDRRYLQDHELFCSGGSPLVCDSCGKTVGNHKNMRDHLRTHDVKGEKFKLPEADVELSEADFELTEADVKSEDDIEKSEFTGVEQELVPDSQVNDEDASASKISQVSMIKNVARKSICGNCGEDMCAADVVKCMYCLKVVHNNAVHMDNMHPFTPIENAWIYTCRFMTKTATSGKDCMVFMKKKTIETSEDGQKQSNCLFKCLKCRVLCSTKKAVVHHISIKHRIAVYSCNICDSGFTTKRFLREHMYFCQGGDVMKCDLCEKLMGGLKAMSDHMTTIHRHASTRKRQVFPRYGRTTATKIPKMEPQTDDEDEKTEDSDGDENFSEDVLARYFEAVQVRRTKVHVKVCVNCLLDCSADAVKCFYCGEIVSSEKIPTHMQETHPWTPAGSLFPVSCRFVKHQAGVPDIMARPIEITDKSGSMNVSAVTCCSYRCMICNSDCEDSAAVEKHIEDTHNVKGGCCKTCGLCMKKSLQPEHQYFCAGGDILKCVECNKVIGGRPSASNHRTRIHPINPRNRGKKLVVYNPKTFKKEDLERVTTVGKYGYSIVSADCICIGGECTTKMVKCGLCNFVVEKDDKHMKLQHPYCPTNTWIVYCKHSLVSNRTLSRCTVGEKIPDATEDEILLNPAIPSDLKYVYRCNRCDQLFDDHYRLKCHIKAVHLHTERLYTCKHCESLFCNMNTDMFANHVHLCKNGSLFNCEVCEVMCSTAKGLYYHMTRAHPDEKKQKQMQYKEDREENMVIPEGTEVQCSVCEFTTPVVQLIREHMKGQHGFKCARLNQVCKVCYKMFQTRSKRERHEQEEHLNNKRHLCEICGKEFDIPYQLRSHMYYFHRGGREIACLRKRTCTKSEESAICPHCGNLYKSLIACKQHIKNVHTKKPKWQCRYCDRIFACKMTLRVHEDRHIGNKTCRCPYCPYVAYTGYAINKHAEKQHPGTEKPYSMRTVMLPEENKEEQENTATSSELPIPITLINELQGVTAEPLTLEAVDRIEFVGDEANFDDPATKAVVQYFVLKNEQE